MRYDYVIVGAGSSGATLAARLSADPSAQVALIEAGPDYGAAETPEAMKSPNPHRIITEAEYGRFRWDGLDAQRTAAQAPRAYWRGRGLGGSSAINGQIAIRGMAEDYDGWAAAGCQGWSFADVLPAFRRLETDLRYGDRPYHGDAGPIPIYRAPAAAWGPVDMALAEAALDAGHPWAADHNAPGALGVSPYAINSRDGVRVSTNDAYLAPVRGRNNLAVFADTLVDRVLFEGDRAVGVRVLGPDGWREVRGAEVILAAGAVHSPAVLLRSGVGPADELAALGAPLRADLPVGRSFQDHPAIFLIVRLRPDGIPPPGFRHTNVCVRYSSGLAGAGPGDMMLVAMNRFGDSLGSHLADPTQPAFGLIGVWVNECVSRGRVTVASTDPAAHPVIEQNMLSEASDRERLREGVRRLAALGRAAPVAALGEALPIPDLDDDARLDAWIAAHAGDTQHATSTCRMGDPRDPATVVDSACRVLGLEGLRVIDASIMPSVVRANTHLTTVMIAEVMAERIAAGG